METGMEDEPGRTAYRRGVARTAASRGWEPGTEETEAVIALRRDGPARRSGIMERRRTRREDRMPGRGKREAAEPRGRVMGLESREEKDEAGLDYLLIAGAATLWGSVGVFLRWIDLPGKEHFVVFIRSVVSVAFLAAVIAAGGRMEDLRPGDHPLLLLVSGALLTLHWVLFLKALNNLPIGDAVFITYLAPVLVALLAPPLLKERLEATTLLALALALGGMGLISLTGQADGAEWSGAGIIYALCSAVSYALLLFILKFLRRDTPSLTVTFYQTAVNAAVLLPFCVFRGFAVTPRGWLLLVVLGLVHTGLAGLVYVYAVKRVKAQHVGIIAYLEPASAMLYGLLFLGEPVSWQDLVGGLLIILAGSLVIRRAWASG